MELDPCIETLLKRLNEHINGLCSKQYTDWPHYATEIRTFTEQIYRKIMNKRCRLSTDTQIKLKYKIEELTYIVEALQKAIHTTTSRNETHQHLLRTYNELVKARKHLRELLV